MIAVTSKTDCDACGKSFSYTPTLYKRGGEVLHCRPHKCQDCKRTHTGIHTCQKCGNSWTGRKMKYCSAQCRERYNYEKTQRVAKESTCVGCGATMTDANGKRYCSHECSRRKVSKVCEGCGNQFMGQERSKVCSDTCKNTRRKRINLEKINATAVGNAYQITKAMATGQIGEKLFDVWCIGMGIEAATPIMENNPLWDRLVRIEGEWCTVQIKTHRTHRNYANACRMTDNSVDLIATVELSTGDVVLFERDSKASVDIDKIGKAG